MSAAPKTVPARSRHRAPTGGVASAAFAMTMAVAGFALAEEGDAATVSASRDEKPAPVHRPAAGPAARKPNLPTISFAVPAAVAKIAGVTLLCDGAEQRRLQWSRLTPVEAGVHEVLVQAPGFKPWRFSFVIPAKRGNTAIDIKPLEPEGAIRRLVSPLGTETP
jgi:hypothetical protein